MKPRQFLRNTLYGYLCPQKSQSEYEYLPDANAMSHPEIRHYV